VGFEALMIDDRRVDCERLQRRLCIGGSWMPFVARVLVEGPWGCPDEVTPVWVIEGFERPVAVTYYFD